MKNSSPCLQLRGGNVSSRMHSKEQGTLPKTLQGQFLAELTLSVVYSLVVEYLSTIHQALSSGKTKENTGSLKIKGFNGL